MLLDHHNLLSVSQAMRDYLNIYMYIYIYVSQGLFFVPH